MSSERSESAKGARGDEGPPKKAPRRSLRLAAKRQRETTMRPCLDGLTESLTLQIFEELDFCSLAAVKRTSRRFHRIASDASLFRRVSRVQWKVFSERRYGWPWGAEDPTEEDRGPESLFRTDCLQLGPIRLPWQEKAAAAKFLVILEGLLKGGASPVSLQTPWRDDGDVVAALPALLAKHQVRLEALTCCTHRVSFKKLLRRQPGIAFLTVCNGISNGGEDLPRLRQLTIAGWELQSEIFLVWLEKSVPQLRSLILHETSIRECLKNLRRLMEVKGGGLFFRGVGDLARHPSYVALAVEDFRVEELGAPFLKDGRPSDPWHLVTHRIPQPTPNLDTARHFIEAACKH